MSFTSWASIDRWGIEDFSGPRDNIDIAHFEGDASGDIRSPIFSGRLVSKGAFAFKESGEPGDLVGRDGVEEGVWFGVSCGQGAKEDILIGSHSAGPFLQCMVSAPRASRAYAGRVMVWFNYTQ